MKRFITILIIFGFIIASAGCSEDVQQTDNDGGPVDAGRDVVDTEDASDVKVEDVSQDAADAGDNSDTSLTCMPGESWCESARVRTECSAINGQEYSYTCLSGHVCRDGECVAGDPCEPGAVLRCTSDSALAVCTEMGNDTIVESCPTEKPLCVDGACVGVCEPRAVLGCADEHTLSVCNDIGNGVVSEACPSEMSECAQGVCVPRICTPGVKRCRGTEIVKCNVRGIEEVVIEECAESCSNATCQFPDYTNCSNAAGCEFYAVELPNGPQRCFIDEGCYRSKFCPYSVCPMATCENGYCRYPTRETISFGIAVTNPAAGSLSVTVTDSAGGTIQATIPAGGGTLIPLPAQVVSASVLSDRSFHIETDGPANVFQLNPMRRMLPTEEALSTGDASSLIPIHALGTSYIFPSWSGGGRTEPALLTIVGTRDATTVTVTPTATLAAGTNLPAVPAGSTTTYALNRGEVLQYKLDPTAVPQADLTGTEIQSDKAVAVFSSLEAALIPFDINFADHIESQVPPISQWGSRYIIAKFATKTIPGATHEPDIYRVMASQDGTIVSTQPTIIDVNGARLDRGEFIEFEYRGDFESQRQPSHTSLAIHGGNQT
jgi:hypothetical protein